MGVNGKGRVQFGDFELDILSGKLCRAGRPVKIQPQPLRVLSVLLEHPGEIVSREDLRARIWGTSTFVEFDQGLNYCIRQIRLALGDEASEPIYIETLPKQGYRFIAPISANGKTAEQIASMAPVPPPPARKPLWKILAAATVLIAFVSAAAFFRTTQPSAARQPATYTQITSFTDAAVNPVLSPDGRMVAFYRSDRTFWVADQIYAKMLPDGEPVQLTHDPRLKYDLAFSPDGSRIAYTVMEHGWHTYTVSSLGGDSTLIPSECRGPELARPTPAAVLGNQNGRAHGHCDCERRSLRTSRNLFPHARARHGALFLCFAGPQMGSGGRDGSAMAPLPAGSLGRRFSGQASGAFRRVHVGGMVARRKLDVFWS